MALGCGIPGRRNSRCFLLWRGNSGIGQDLLQVAAFSDDAALGTIDNYESRRVCVGNLDIAPGRRPHGQPPVLRKRRRHGLRERPFARAQIGHQARNGVGSRREDAALCGGQARDHPCELVAEEAGNEPVAAPGAQEVRALAAGDAGEAILVSALVAVFKGKPHALDDDGVGEVGIVREVAWKPLRLVDPEALEFDRSGGGEPALQRRRGADLARHGGVEMLGQGVLVEQFGAVQLCGGGSDAGDCGRVFGDLLRRRGVFAVDEAAPDEDVAGGDRVDATVVAAAAKDNWYAEEGYVLYGADESAFGVPLRGAVGMAAERSGDALDPVLLDSGDC